MVKRVLQILRRLSGRRRKHAIIIGADYPEYRLYQQLEAEKEYRVLFFIDEDPWKRGTKIGEAELRFPSDLEPLCEKHGVEAVFYVDEKLLAELPSISVPLIGQRVS